MSDHPSLGFHNGTMIHLFNKTIAQQCIIKEMGQPTANVSIVMHLDVMDESVLTLKCKY